MRRRSLVPGSLATAILALAVMASLSPTTVTRATHDGKTAQAISIDMNTTGNSASALGALDQCARIDAGNSGSLDITVEGVPNYVDNNPMGVVDSNDTGGIISFAYNFVFPAGVTVNATPDQNFMLNVNANSSLFNADDPTPDSNNPWSSTQLDLGSGIPEVGSGVLTRINIAVGAGMAAGQYPLQLESHALGDASGGFATPHTTNVGAVAVGQDCVPVVTTLGYYHPIPPERILDTRGVGGIPLGAPIGKVGAGDANVRNVSVIGPTSVPDTGVSAVVLNATAVLGTTTSYLTIYPFDAPMRPTASNLNFTKNKTVPNLATVKISSDGRVKLYNNAGLVHVLFDIVGYYAGPTGGALFESLVPKRILDTRGVGGLPLGAPIGKLGAGATISVDVTNTESSGVPAAGVDAVVLNATVTKPTAGDSFLTVYPADLATRPTVSNLNYTTNQTVPNLIIVKVGVGGANDGKVKVYNNRGTVHVIFDVVGWYGTGATRLFHTLEPKRILDTRTAPQGVPAGKVGAGDPAVATVDVTDTVGSGVPATATAVIVNTTAVASEAPDSYLTVFPADAATRPTASNLNYVTNLTIANLVIVKVSASGDVKVYNNLGKVHVLFDVVGYFE